MVENAANNALNDAAGCWLLAAPAAGVVNTNNTNDKSNNPFSVQIRPEK